MSDQNVIPNNHIQNIGMLEPMWCCNCGCDRLTILVKLNSTRPAHQRCANCFSTALATIPPPIMTEEEWEVVLAQDYPEGG